MYCPNCGNKVGEGKFCPNCGQEIKVNNTNVIVEENDEDLVKAYVGPKYEEFAKENFSVCTFFFSILYTWYRKMWIFGLIWFGALFFAGLIFDDIIYNIISLGSSIGMAIIFKKQYLIHARKKVAEIKYNYHGNDRESLIALCRKKGGTTIVPILLVFIPLILIIIIMMILFGILWNQKKVINRDYDYDLPKLTINNKLFKDNYTYQNYELIIKM